MPLWQDEPLRLDDQGGHGRQHFYRLPSNRVLELGQQLVV